MSVEAIQLEESPHSVGNHSIDARPKNWLTPVVLLGLREKSSYGYELMGWMAKPFGLEATNYGSLYRALRHMEKDGLCKSEWEASKESGPACRVYSITKAGEAYLSSWVEESEKFQGILDSFYLAYDDGAGSSGRATAAL